MFFFFKSRKPDESPGMKFFSETCWEKSLILKKLKTQPEALNEAFSSLEKVNFNLKEHNGDLQKKYQKASNLRYTAEKSRDDNVKPIPQELRIQYNKALRKIAILDETHPLVGDSRFKFCLTVLRSLTTGILTNDRLVWPFLLSQVLWRRKSKKALIKFSFYIYIYNF